ncbi:MAG: recombinase family protein [Polyangiaceae bacterium]|nr:recombinase family protein [Polyangiaceae bacterium]
MQRDHRRPRGGSAGTRAAPAAVEEGTHCGNHAPSQKDSETANAVGFLSRPIDFSSIKKVVAYTRVSTYEQKLSGVSLPEQQREIARFCEMRGLPVPQPQESVEDLGQALGVLFAEVESGTEGASKRRVKLQYALQLMGPNVLFLVPKLDRFSRSTMVALEALKLIKLAGARFYSIAEACDPHSPESQWIFIQWVAGAEMESARIATRTSAGRQYLREQGCYTEGPIWLGYVRTRRPRRGVGPLAINDEQKPIVVEMFILRDQGWSTHKIAALFITKYPHVRKWTASVIRVLLRARVYIGQMRSQARTGEWIDAHPAIVDRELFFRVQRKLDEARKRSGRPTTGKTYDEWFCHGLMKCAACGRGIASIPYHRMRESSRKPKARRSEHTGYYVCAGFYDGRPDKMRCRGWTPRPRNEDVHTAVAKLVGARIDALAAIWSSPTPPVEPYTPTDFAAQKQRQKDAIRRALDGYAFGDLSSAELRALRQAANDEIAKLEAAESAELRARQQFTDAMAKRALLAALPSLRDLWRFGTPAEHRQFTALLAERITLSQRSEVTIHWRDPMELVKKLGIVGGDGLLSKADVISGISTHFLQQPDCLEITRKLVASALEAM